MTWRLRYHWCKIILLFLLLPRRRRRMMMMLMDYGNIIISYRIIDTNICDIIIISRRRRSIVGIIHRYCHSSISLLLPMC